MKRFERARAPTGFAGAALVGAALGYGGCVHFDGHGSDGGAGAVPCARERPKSEAAPTIWVSDPEVAQASAAMPEAAEVRAGGGNESAREDAQGALDQT